MRRKESSISTTEISPLNDDKEVEYFFASDASAIIEHTNRVIFLEDDDVASICDGRKTIFTQMTFFNNLIYLFY